MQPILTDSQSSEFAASTNFTGVNLSGPDAQGKAKGYCVVSSVTVTTPTPKTFTADATTDLLTAAAHGYKTGLKVQVSSTTTLPGGLSAATDYFVIVVAANTFKLASSLANAQAGTAIDITSAGTGTHTATATALAGASVKLQGSIDGTTYVDLAVSSNITATADFIFEKVDPMFNRVRSVYTLASGQLSVSQSTLVKGF